MRIVILSFFSGIVERGVEVYVQELADRLRRHHRVDVISPEALRTRITPYTNTESPLLRRLYLDSVSLQIKHGTTEILRELEHHPPDFLYPVNNGWQSLQAKKFCARHKTKLILAGHAGPGWDDRINLWLKPDAFIAFSRPQAAWAKKRSRGVNVIIIPHGVNLQRFNPKKKPKLLKLKSPIFVTVSALSPKSRGGLPAKAFGWRLPDFLAGNGGIAAWDIRRLLRQAVNATAGETVKNIDATIKAVAMLSQASLLVIGEGSDSHRIDKLGQKYLGIKRYQRITVSHNIIPYYYTAADAFTLASGGSEAFGLAYLEALASGLPVITSDDQLRRYIIGDAGIYIKNPRNTAEYSRGLAQALQTNWDDRPRHQAQKFSWERIIHQYEKLFAHLT